MRIALRNPKTYIILAVDALLLYLSYFLAHWLRFESFSGDYLDFFYESVFYIIALKLTIFYFFGLQSGMWRYTGIYDLINLIKASITSLIFISVGLVYLYYPDFVGKISRSVFIIDAINTIGLIGVFRLGIRVAYSRIGSDAGVAKLAKEGLFGARPARNGVTAVIYGAGNRGENLLRSILTQPKEGGKHFNILGFIDDDSRLDGVSIHGVSVLGSFTNFDELVKRFMFKEILVAKRLSTERIEQVSKACRRLGVRLRIVPGQLDTDRHSVNAEALRELTIEDLLFRDPAPVDYSMIEKTFHGKKALITGAGGSIGGALAKELAEFRPAQIILVDKAENYLHEMEITLGPIAQKNGVELFYYCSNVTDKTKMNKIFSSHKPDMVFHAAAYKHVPMMERNRDEAIKNNVGGMKTIADLSENHRVDRFILISSDKAVNPVNIMGATKRLCELYLFDKADKAKTCFMAVRFGNVLGSNGSVAPLFRRQIEKGGPVTVTHQDIERYFMTIQEAVLLILQSATMGRQSELFLLDMGKPVKILDLAERMIEVAGFKPYDEIDILFTGLREGEKLNEELIGSGESLENTDHTKISRVLSPSGVLIKGDRSFNDRLERWLKESGVDPEKTTCEIVDWLNGRQPSSGANIIDFPSKNKEQKRPFQQS